MVGRSLGHYDILEPLGAGGMGEVYRAHDKNLKRDVASKVLPEDLSADPDRLARLEREADLLAALNPPPRLMWSTREVLFSDSEGRHA